MMGSVHKLRRRRGDDLAAAIHDGDVEQRARAAQGLCGGPLMPLMDAGLLAPLLDTK